MPISYPEILDVESKAVPFSWTDRETMLYALGTGMGEDPSDPRELPFVYERDLKTLPTFATIVARPGDPGPLPINRAMVLDGRRSLTLHQPMPAAADVRLDGRIVNVFDRGADKGAVITREVVIRAVGGEKIATLVTDVVARGDGGFGGPPPPPSGAQPAPARMPDRIVRIATRPNQALIYRLSGDRNPLHCDPGVAAKAGFAAPILHGLCTYGICCRSLLQSYADYDPTAIREFSARFAAPCYPGETIAVSWWKDGESLRFEARVEDRDLVIVRDGRATLG